MGAEFDFAVIGGDLRQVYLADLLNKKGYQVTAYGLAKGHECPGFNGKISESLKDAVINAKTVIGPTPFAKGGKLAAASDLGDEADLESLADQFAEGQRLWGGCIPDNCKEVLEKRGVQVCDFMKSEELAVFNSIATAEGAVAEAFIHYPGNLHGCSCLVLGYGKCGVTLAHKLWGLQAQVTICARNPIARSQARAKGFEAIVPEGLGSRLSRYGCIFNTIPEVILDRELLGCVGREAWIIDLASAPGGLDYHAAGELAVHAKLCPGLPGRYSPKSSAEAMAKLVIEQAKQGNQT